MALVTALLADQVLMIWVGPRFAESVPIVWLLAAIVVIRIGTGTGTSLLKGANRHKFVAVTSVIIAVTNFALSVALVRPLGLIGVAIGTLVPVGGVSLFALYPAACQRVGLSVWEATRISVWPAVWPAIPTTLVVLATRGYAGHHVVAVAAVAVLGGLTYAGTFVFIALRPGSGAGTSTACHASVVVESRSPRERDGRVAMTATTEQCRRELEAHARGVSGARRMLLDAALRGLEQLPDLPLPQSVKDGFCREFEFIATADDAQFANYQPGNARFDELLRRPACSAFPPDSSIGSLAGSAVRICSESSQRICLVSCGSSPRPCAGCGPCSSVT